MGNIPLKNPRFNLDASGVAGFLGTSEGATAIDMMYMYENRKWLGWYNSPGSYPLAQRYRKLADAIAKSNARDLSTFFELDGKKGPRFTAAKSGTVIPETGHIAYLLSKKCEEMLASPLGDKEARVTSPVEVTIVKLRDIESQSKPRLKRTSSGLLSIIPIVVSLSTCAVCGAFRDWYSFSTILLGIVSGGASCYVIGSGEVGFKRPAPSKEAPDGDGILVGDREVVILKGKEAAVRSITTGKFTLSFRSSTNIARCSLLLTAQFLVQLLLVPQGYLFGQIMFLISLAVSWIYSNSFLSSFDSERRRRDILIEEVLGNLPEMKKYRLGTRTSMAVFVVLVLGSQQQMLLSDLLPTDTPVWNRWHETVLREIEKGGPFNFDDSDLVGKDLDTKLLGVLYKDARTAYVAYEAYLAIDTGAAIHSPPRGDSEPV